MTNPYPLPPNETERLAALDRLQIVGTSRALDFDSVLALALRITGCRAGVIGLMEGDRHWFKAESGLNRDDAPRHLSLCNFTLLQTDPLIIEDLRRDLRFRDNHFVKTRGTRFYAGVALSGEGGVKVGTLCVTDDHPRAGTPELFATLRALGQIVEGLLASHTLATRATELAQLSELRERQMWKNTRLLGQSERLAKIGSWEMDTATGAFLLSDEARRIQEVGPEDVLTVALLRERMSPELRALTPALYERCLATGEGYEYRGAFTTAKGSLRWEHVITEAEQRDGKVVRIFGTIRDVTEEYLAEQSLRRKNARLEQIERMAKIGVWEVDLETGAVIFSDECCRINDVEAGTSVDMDELRSHWPQASRERSKALFDQIKLDGKGYEYINELVTAKGNRRWMHSVVDAELRDGKVVRIFGTARDITADHLAEQALQKKTRMLEQSERLARIGSWERNLDSDTFSMSAENYRIQELDIGAPLKRDDLLARMAPELRGRVLALQKICIETGQGYEYSGEFTTAKGNRRWMHVVVDAEMRNGKVVRVFGTVRDITAEHLAQQSLRKTTRLLEQSERVARMASWERDIKNGTALMSSGNWDIHELDHGEILTMEDIRSRMPEDVQADTLRLFERALETGESYDYCGDFYTRKGNKRRMHVVAETELENGKVVRVFGSVRDVTAEHLAVQALRKKTRLLEQSERLAKIGSWERDIATGACLMSAENYRIHEIDPNELLTMEGIRDRMPADIREEALRLFKRCVATGEPYEYRGEFLTSRGNRRRMHVIAEAEMEAGKVVRVVGSVRDVTSEYLIEQKLWRAAHYDVLTDSPNRHHWTGTLDQAFARAYENRSGLTILMFDLDGFKEINDTRGHAAGDAVLREVAQRLLDTLPQGAFHARLGGDEFAVLLEGTMIASEIEKVVRNLLAEIQRPIVIDDTHLQISGTFGCASFPVDASTASDLMQKADIALYQAKRTQRNSFVLFRPEIGGLFNEKRDAIDLVAAAIEDGRLVPFYQPKIDLKTGRAAGFEALCHIEAADGTILGPAQFLPALQDPASSARIGVAMLDLVTADLAMWLSEGLEPGRVAVNVTGADFLDGALDRRVLGRLAELGLPATALEIEVTENTILGKEARMVGDALQAMRDHGIVIALDDFGTGFASLTHLRDAPIDYIKLDRSFISGLGSGADSAIIVKSIVDLGHGLGMRIVAEGIETAGQGEFLRAIGCDEAQGFLYGRPASQEATYVMLEQKTPAMHALAAG